MNGAINTTAKVIRRSHSEGSLNLQPGKKCKSTVSAIFSSGKKPIQSAVERVKLGTSISDEDVMKLIENLSAIMPKLLQTHKLEIDRLKMQLAVSKSNIEHANIGDHVPFEGQRYSPNPSCNTTWSNPQTSSSSNTNERVLGNIPCEKCKMFEEKIKILQSQFRQSDQRGVTLAEKYEELQQNNSTLRSEIDSLQQSIISNSSRISSGELEQFAPEIDPVTNLQQTSSSGSGMKTASRMETMFNVHCTNMSHVQLAQEIKKCEDMNKQWQMYNANREKEMLNQQQDYNVCKAELRMCKEKLAEKEQQSSAEIERLNHELTATRQSLTNVSELQQQSDENVAHLRGQLQALSAELEESKVEVGELRDALVVASRTNAQQSMLYRQRDSWGGSARSLDRSCSRQELQHHSNTSQPGSGRNNSNYNQIRTQRSQTTPPPTPVGFFDYTQNE